MSLSTHHSTDRAFASFSAVAMVRSVIDMFAIARQRHTLNNLPEHLLHDIGVSAEEAREEASRAPWDVPAHWRG